MITRRPLLFGLGCVAATGCKRKHAPPVAEVWDEEPMVAQAEAIGALAPPWPAPSRGQLDNGLITFWLREPEGVAMQIRLLVPTTVDDAAPPGEAIVIAAEHARSEWQRRVQKLGVTVAIEHGPHRFEVVASGADSQLVPTLAALRSVVGTQAPSGIDGARTRIEQQTPARSNLELAAIAMLVRLVGVDEGVDVSRLAKTTRAQLHAHWHALLDPRRNVLLIHSGTPAEAIKGDLRKLAEAWRGSDARDRNERVLDQATARLRRRAAPTSTGTRLLAMPATPMLLAPSGSGGPTLVIGRSILLANANDRALARLAQRVCQEEIDASVVIAGNTATWMVATGVGRASPEREVQRAVEEHAFLAKTRHPRQRLFQAVQLWLGARVVEASLGGEDWTRLFASAMDLADTDTAIAGALAGDAKRQLAITPDELEAWTRRWLDPRAGEPGWAWATAGLDAQAVKRIERVTPVA